MPGHSASPAATTLAPATQASGSPTSATSTTLGKNGLDISSQVDRSEITIGDRIQYEIKVVYPKEGNVELPSVLGNLGAFEVKDYQAEDPKPAGALKIQTWHFNLSTFTVGKYTLPPQVVLYRKGNDTAVVAGFYTQPIEINVVRTSPETVKDIADIAGLIEPKSGRPWLLYGIGAAVLALAGYFFWRRLRKKNAPAPEKPPLPPFEEAMEALIALKTMILIRQNRAREFCFQLSESLRRYISRRYGVEALEQTTSEFLVGVKKYPITMAQKDWLGKFCDATDLVKFANAALNEAEAVQWLAQTEDFLRQTRPREDGTTAPGNATVTGGKA